MFGLSFNLKRGRFEMMDGCFITSSNAYRAHPGARLSADVSYGRLTYFLKRFRNELSNHHMTCYALSVHHITEKKHRGRNLKKSLRF